MLNADLVTSDSLAITSQFTGQEAFTIDQAKADADTSRPSKPGHLAWRSVRWAGVRDYRFVGTALWIHLVIEGNDAQNDDYDVTSPAVDQVSYHGQFWHECRGGYNLTWFPGRGHRRSTLLVVATWSNWMPSIRPLVGLALPSTVVRRR